MDGPILIRICNQADVSNFTIMGVTRLISIKGNLIFGTGVEGLVVPTMICEHTYLGQQIANSKYLENLLH